MSKTKDHNNSRHILDLWSKRPGSYGIKTKYCRNITARIERQNDRKIVRDELKEMENENVYG